MLDLLAPHRVAAFEELAARSRRLPGGGTLRRPGPRLPAAGGTCIGHRGYSAGDDPRHLDWAVAGRADELLTRVYRADSVGPVDILVDQSASMSLGRPPKAEVACSAAAALAYVAAASLQPVRVTAFADGVVDASPQVRCRAQFGKIAKFFARGENAWGGREQRTDVKRTAEDFVRRRGRPGVAVWVSDLFDPVGFAGAIDLLRDHGYAQRVLHLVDPADARVPTTGDTGFFDVEVGRSQATVVTESVRDALAAAYEDFLAGVWQSFAARGIPCVRVITPSADVGQATLSLFFDVDHSQGPRPGYPSEGV